VAQPKEFEQITLDIEEGIATLTLNRPAKMNAFTGKMMYEMIEAFDITDADDNVRVVIVTGSGDRAFCAGADLSEGAKTFDYDKRAEGGEVGRTDDVDQWRSRGYWRDDAAANGYSHRIRQCARARAVSPSAI